VYYTSILTYKKEYMKTIISSISIIVVNLVPLFGAIFLGWDLTTLLIIYWSENIAIGFWNIFKLLKAPRVNDKNNKYHISFEDMTKEEIDRINNSSNLAGIKLSYTLFFMVHYSLFTFVHGFFIFSTFLQATTNFLLYLPGIIFTFILIFLSHGFSYLLNFIGKREYEETSLTELMIKPYKRIFITHFVVILVSIALQELNDTFLPALILIIIKTIGDLIFHIIEHTKPSNKWSK